MCRGFYLKLSAERRCATEEADESSVTWIAALARLGRNGHSVRVPSPGSVLTAWFAAHAVGDMDAARALMADHAAVRVPDGEVYGFDAFMQWYAKRRAALPAFRYEVLDILGGEHPEAPAPTSRQSRRGVDHAPTVGAKR
jgi:hypothetical protein